MKVNKQNTKPNLMFIGGFLGAGKTTLLGSIAQVLSANGYKVGLITNDQAQGLVDTHVLSANGTAVQEIAGSCFCCDFDGLMEAALYLKEVVGCTYIVAEPVGSCTDLSATLMQPLKSYHIKHFNLMPLAVLVDPVRFLQTFEAAESTVAGSGYIYLKQLEEADHILINKIDLLGEEDHQKIEAVLQKRFKNYTTHHIAALHGQGIADWLLAMEKDPKVGSRLADVDYDIYAQGEALMGWYNADFVMYHTQQLLVPWKAFNLNFITLLQKAFQFEGVAIGHLKTFIKGGPSTLKANLTHTQGQVAIVGNPFSAATVKLTLNIRAETDPENLKAMVTEVLEVFATQGIIAKTENSHHLSPGRPMPTHQFQEII